jgi:hypothetical protein
MTKKQVWLYTCDHCGKYGRSGGHMARHEKSCTANPARICRMCAAMGLGKSTVAELRALLPAHDKTLSKWRPAVSGDTEAPFDKNVDVQDYRDAITAEVVKALPALTEAAGGCPACMLAALRQHGLGWLPRTAWNFKAALAEAWANSNDAAATRGYEDGQRANMCW